MARIYDLEEALGGKANEETAEEEEFLLPSAEEEEEQKEEKAPQAPSPQELAQQIFGSEEFRSSLAKAVAEGIKSILTPPQPTSPQYPSATPFAPPTATPTAPTAAPVQPPPIFPDDETLSQELFTKPGPTLKKVVTQAITPIVQAVVGLYQELQALRLEKEATNVLSAKLETVDASLRDAVEEELDNIASVLGALGVNLQDPQQLDKLVQIAVERVQQKTGQSKGASRAPIPPPLAGGSEGAPSLSEQEIEFRQGLALLEQRLKGGEVRAKVR